MADTKISALTSATLPLSGSELVPIVQSGTTVKTAISNIASNQPPTPYTANGVVYASSTSALATGSGLTFNGTTFSTTNDASIHGLTVGQGAGSVSNNTALGNGTLSNGSTTGGRNVAIGFNAGNTLSSGAQNTLIGSYCGTGLTTGTQNIGIGDGALTGNSTGATGSYNVGIGALTLLTSGSSNTAIGYQALQSNNTASYNTAVGYQSLQANITGTYQVALGYRSAYNATASYSVYIGQGAGYSHSTSSENNGSVFVGNSAGGIAGGLTGHDNTYIGGSSGSAMTSGSKNTILGQYTGNQTLPYTGNTLDIRTSSGNIVISDGDGKAWLYINSSGLVRMEGITSNTTANAANVQCDAAGSLRTSTSALKYKTNVRDFASIDINKFRPVVYNSLCDDDDKTKDHFGFIADEVDQSGIKELVSYDSKGEVNGFQYERMTVVLTKAIQELNAEVQSLKAKVGA